MTTLPVILQVCRRFGPVGGMERYVWELCRELANMGYQVHVLCEMNLCTEPLLGVHIHELGTVRPKPRWLAHIRFSKHVHQWLEKNRTAEMIIHSHERTQDHHITTFHGPPFAQVRDFALWHRFSLRTQMNLWLEKRELFNHQVQIIVPNSTQISDQLTHYYPNIGSHLAKPIVPGVTVGLKRPFKSITPNAGVIGFIGKEWKRKGLKKSIQIVSKLAETRPDLHFIVAGPLKEAVQSLFKSVNFNFTLLGQVDSKQFYPQLDILLHPASKEPYGMVITEALSSGVPVVVSDVCGAASEITSQLGHTLPLHADNQTWAKAIESCLSQLDYQRIHYHRSWRDSAIAYQQLYKCLAPYSYGLDYP